MDRNCSTCAHWRRLGNLLDTAAGKCTTRRVIAETGIATGSATVGEFTCGHWQAGTRREGEAA